MYEQPPHAPASLKQVFAWTSIALALCASPFAQAQGSAAAKTEAPPVFNAASLLTPQLLAGADFRVEDRVLNDGLMNHYVISSNYGSFKASSDAELVKRVHEIGAIAKLKQLQGSKEFAKGIGDAGERVVEGTKALVTSPVKTIGGIFEGAGTLLRRASDSVMGDPQSQYEDSKLQAASGVSQSKRDFAAPLGVDPYSSNATLQEDLTRVARASAGGYIVTSAAMAAISGGAGTFLSVTGTSQTLNEMLTRTPPTDIRRMNREKLLAMGIGVDLVDVYLANAHYSPTYQLLLVNALDGMRGVGGREVALKVAIGADSDALCMLRQRQMRMYAGLHNGVQALERFVASGNLIIARARDGKTIIAIPTDHVAWTEAIAANVANAEASLQALGNAGTGGRELWLGGTISPLARSAMEARGFKIFEKSATKLIGPG